MRYLIPVNKLEELKKRLEKINKKNPGIIKYLEIGETVKKQALSRAIFNGEYSELKKVGSIYVRCMEVEVEGEYKLENWKFVASLQHTENGNIIRNISNQELPLTFRSTDCYCEHCKKIRRRNDTYVVFNSKTNEYKQVGKQCLKDYTGLDSQVVASSLNFMEQIILNENYEESDLQDSSSPACFDTETIQVIAYYYVSKYGYNKQSSENATVNSIASELFSDTCEIKDFNDYKKSVKNTLDEITEFAKKLDVTSEFNNNCKVAWLNKYTSYKNFVFIAFLVKMYIEYKTKSENSKNSKYVGNIKEKIVVYIKSFRVLYTKQGYSYNSSDSSVYEIIDENDNIYIWSTATELDKVKSIKATVKEHKEYKGVKQTVITRGKIIEKKS